VNPADLHALSDGDLDTREEFAYRLVDRAEDGDEAAKEALRAMVRDYPRYHRAIFCAAMNRASAFVDGSLAGPLLAALDDSRYNCPAWAAMGCSAGGFTAAVPRLITLLDHPDWVTRKEAMTALGRLGDDTVVPVLVPLLDAPDLWMREAAADSLSRIGGDAALAALWEQFTNRRYSRIGHIASALALFVPEVVPRLIEAADSPDPDQRYWAAVALGSTGDDRAVPTLERLMATDRGSTVFDGMVSVAAKKGLRTLRRIQAAIAARTTR
jgi:HEAT repeat protein